MLRSAERQMLDEVCIACFVGTLSAGTHTHDEACLHLLAWLSIVSEDVAHPIGKRPSSLLSESGAGEGEEEKGKEEGEPYGAESLPLHTAGLCVYVSVYCHQMLLFANRYNAVGMPSGCQSAKYPYFLVALRPAVVREWSRRPWSTAPYLYRASAEESIGIRRGEAHRPAGHSVLRAKLCWGTPHRRGGRYSPHGRQSSRRPHDLAEGYPADTGGRGRLCQREG